MPAVGRANKPKSLVDHLNDQAPKRVVNEAVSISRYMLSAQMLISQATQYRDINYEEQLYVILLRFASLVVETIPKHRDFSPSNPAYVALKRDLLGRYLPELERLKASLRLKDRPEPPTAMSRNRPADAVQLSVSNLPEINWASSGAAVAEPSAPPAAAAPAPSMTFQVDDLLDVMRGGPSAPPAPSTSGGSPDSSLALVPARPGAVGTAMPLPNTSDPYALAAAAAAALAASSASSPEGVPGLPQLKYSTSYAASSSRHALFGHSASAGRAADAQRLSQSVNAVGSLPRYPALDVSPPSAPAAAAAAAASLAQLSISPAAAQVDQLAYALAVPHPSAGPSLGPQEVGVIHISPSAPGLPDTCGVAHGPLPPAPPAPPPLPATAGPPAPGGPKELVKRAQLRDVHVSMALVEDFLQFARSNTSRGIESCGILAGKLLAGDSTFAITTLIIPKQQGTTDTVQALNEEEIFEAQFARELYPLGWIHTHPTQTCFLSSVDVHTQCGYQTMLDEAVAIVMAPTDASKRCGIFRLSTPGGLSLVQKCPSRGFHAHPPTDTGQELYELCGHVFLNPRTKFDVLDLR